MAEFEVKPKQVLVGNWRGCGVQFNQNVYSKLTDIPEERFADLHAKVHTLAPQFVRMFYNDKQAGDPSDAGQTNAQKDIWASFVRTARLAQGVGATINVTWQSGPHVSAQDREASMRRFADALDRLVTTSKITNLR